ncbi:MAG: T9SS type A sorting domain-containing protein, partial [Flavobacteriales bacterium]
NRIYTSQHIISAPTSAGVNENSVVASNFRVGYNGESNALNFSFHSLIAGEMSVNIVDLNGRSVFFGNLGNAVVGENIESLKLPSDFKNGIYIANFFVNNNAMSAKFMVQR